MPESITTDIARSTTPARPTTSGQKSFFQPKLTINQPNDVYEQEADAVADKVMRMTDTATMGAPFFTPSIPVISRKCEHCEEEERKMQRKALNGGESNEVGDIENYVDRLHNGGQSLSGEARHFFEPRFGRDFSSVKIHTDAVAAKSAQSINALAYTTGDNIVFNSGQYSPGTDTGKKLLGHELTHVVQQNASSIAKKTISRINMNDGEPAIQRSCTQDFSRYTGATCRGTIQVGATTIGLPIAGYYHLFILYTDSTGVQFYLRGGPLNPPSGGYGNIIVRCEPYVEGQIEYDSRNVLEQVYDGDDACNKLTTMQQRLNEIESWNIAYVPAGPNSNSVIATLLRAAGLPLRKPAVPTPGFEMEVVRTGSTPLSQDRPTLFLISLGGGNGLLLNAEVQQRLYTFSPVIGGGIPIPIPLELSAGLYSFPDQRRVGGSLGLGTDISLINLPLPVFSPLGIVVGGGLTAGSVQSTDTTGSTRTDPEIGGYARAGLYTDISRFRISPLYQYNNMFNTATGTSTSEHSFVVQLGYTF